MELKKNYLLIAMTAAALTGCGSDSSSGGNNTGTPGDGNGTPVAGLPTGNDSYSVSCNQDSTQCTISGTINEDVTLPSEVKWVLSGSVFVGEGQVEITDAAQQQAIKDAGVTLTVEAGADVRGTDNATLVVTRGSKLMAEGTAADPITFSSLDDDLNGLGEWGGIIVQGFAPQYGAGNTGVCSEGNAGGFCNVEGEGGLDETIRYGGSDADDNSGVIRYVRIAEGGRVAGPGNEVNGLTLQGVGHATTVEYVQVHDNLDDGIEWFGGTVNARYVVLTGNDDDSIDFDEGYQGNIQYGIVRMSADRAAPSGSNDPRGIEANSSDDEYVTQTNAALANITLVGNPDYAGEPGMRLRGALTANILNTAVFNFSDCVRIDDAATGTEAGTVNSNVTLHNVQGTACGEFYRNEDGGNARIADTETGTNGDATALQLTSAVAVANGAVAQADLPEAQNGSGFAFDNTTYIGAVAPGTTAADAWWAGWTIPGSLSGIVQQSNPAVQQTEIPTGNNSYSVSCDGSTTVCTLSGTINEDVTLSANVQWVLSGSVFVGEGQVAIADAAQEQAIKDAGVTLTVEAGADVRGTDNATLVVTRGSKLMAVGTAAAPITFSSMDDGLSGLGEWGGIIVQGFAPQYGAGGTGVCSAGNADGICNVEGEGGLDETIRYGGNDADDNSGVIRYVRIAEGGRVAGPGNEVNGLTLQGVGHGTTVEFVQVHDNLDDGIEWFGGTVNARYVVLTGNDDDSIDFDEGYKGNIQYGIIRMSADRSAPAGSNDPRGIEANSSDDEYVTETNAALANITLVGNPDYAGEPGMRLRGALTVNVLNTAVFNFSDCVRIDDADTGTAAGTINSDVTFHNVQGSQCGEFYRNEDSGSERTPDTTTGTNGDATALALEAGLAVANSSVAQADLPEAANGSNFTFENTQFVGAVQPGTAAADAWWSGWTIPGSLDGLATQAAGN